MRYQRWCIAAIDSNGWPKGLRGIVSAWSLRHILPDGIGLFECEFEGTQMRAAQSIVTVLPALNAPAEKVPAATLAKLGMTTYPGEAVLDVLRRLRDTLGEDWEVSLPT